MHLLSSVRMGVNLGLIHDLEIPTINKLFIHTQPAHLQKLRGAELPSADRNVERAMYLQTHLRKRGRATAMRPRTTDGRAPYPGRHSLRRRDIMRSLAAGIAAL